MKGEGADALEKQVCQLRQMRRATSTDVPTHQVLGHGMRPAYEPVGPPAIRPRAAHNGNRSLLLRDIPQAQEKKHRGIGPHPGLLLLVPRGEAGHIRHGFLKNEGYAAAGGKEGVQFELKLQPVRVDQAGNEMLGFEKFLDRMAKCSESKGHEFW